MTYKMLTMGEVAELLGVDRSTIWRYVERGSLNPARRDRPVMFAASEIESFAARRADEAAAVLAAVRAATSAEVAS